MHAYGQAKYDAAGHAERMAGSVQDITHKKEQQQAIRRSQEQLRLLIENAPTAIAMFDSEMRYLMTSDRWLQDYRIEGRDIIGMSHYDVFPEIRSMPQWLDIHRRALRGERFDTREDSWTRADGTVEYNQWAIHPWMDATGQVGGIVMFTEVITARKVAEAQLRTSEEMNRAAMDKAPIGKALVSPDGALHQGEPGAVPAARLLRGRAARQGFPVDHASGGSRRRISTTCASCSTAASVSYQMEKRYFHRDGRVIWAQLSVSMVRRASGECDFLVAQVQDITERKAIERIKDEFAAVVRHELHAPLTTIRDSLGLINGMRGVALPAQVQRQIDISYASCERLVMLVNDILDLDRIATGHMHFELADESLAAITQQAVPAARPTRASSTCASRSSGSIRRSSCTWMRRASRRCCRTCFPTPRSSRRAQGEIEVGAERRGGSVRIFVRDHGAGIPEEFRDRIFGRFAQAESRAAREKGGTGLGLHITRQLVERMNGTIGFVSQVGLGTTFWIEFPCVSPDKRRLRVV